MIVEIRIFQPADAPALAALFHASVHGLGARDYSPAQLAVWSPSPPDPADYLRRAHSRLVLVATDLEGRRLGYGDLEPDGHMDHLYCAPDAVGMGVGAALCDAIEAAARAQGLSALFVEASEAARRLFERRGFGLERRNDFILQGVAIHNYHMRKSWD